MFVTLAGVLAAIAASMALPSEHLNFLASRQDVPAECAASCIPVNTIIASQCTASKCCNADFANAYTDCVECFGTSIQLTNYAPYQSAFDTLFAACSRDDRPIPKLTLPGQNANRNIASTSATITRSQTASVPPSSQRPSASGEITPVASSPPPSPSSSTISNAFSSQVTSSPSTGSASISVTAPPVTVPAPRTSTTAPPTAPASALTASTSLAGSATQSPGSASNVALSLKPPSFGYATVHLVALATCFVGYLM